MFRCVLLIHLFSGRIQCVLLVLVYLIIQRSNVQNAHKTTTILQILIIVLWSPITTIWNLQAIGFSQLKHKSKFSNKSKQQVRNQERNNAQVLLPISMENPVSHVKEKQSTMWRLSHADLADNPNISARQSINARKYTRKSIKRTQIQPLIWSTPRKHTIIGWESITPILLIIKFCRIVHRIVLIGVCIHVLLALTRVHISIWAHKNANNVPMGTLTAQINTSVFLEGEKSSNDQ